VGNALEHGQPGSLVCLSTRGQRHEPLTLTVHNWGEPMAPAVLAMVSEHTATKPELTSLSGHLGLGLYIVLQVAASHGGALSAESSLARGTTLTLTLPRTRG
jgi:phosphoserine phosphatase RsbU/P